MACTNGRSYHIKEGDSLYAIAERVFGDGDRWTQILKSDGCRFTETDANHLVVGQEICLPQGERSEPTPTHDNGSGNALANRVFEITNEQRRRAGVPPLHFHQQLAASAQAHSEDMARHRRMDHKGSDGSSSGDRIRRAGYPRAATAENIAHGQSTPEAVMESWMHSPGHREHILDEKYKNLGIGYAAEYWTQNFGG